MKDLIETLHEEFQDEDYRYAYDEEFSNTRMATQIKVLRDEITQAELAQRADMKQSRISELENVNYSMWTISTLRRIAKALGVRVSFKFESWGDLLPEIEKFAPESLKVPKFEDDPVFQNTTPTVQETAIESVPSELQNMLTGDGLTDSSTTNVEDIRIRKAKREAVNALMGKEVPTADLPIENKRQKRRA